MPVVLRYKGYRFYFYSHEGNPREPVHIHVRKGNTEVKFWLRPFVVVAHNDDVPARDLADLTRIVQRERDNLEREWNAFFQS